MPDLSKKLKVFLSPEYRAELEAICRRKSVAAAKVRRARILLMSDERHRDGRRHDSEIAASNSCARASPRWSTGRDRLARENLTDRPKRIW